VDHANLWFSGKAAGDLVAFGSPLNELFVDGRPGIHLKPGSGFRHIIIKGKRQVVKTIVRGLSATGKFVRDVDKLRIVPTFCFAQAWKVKKMREKIGFLPAV